MFGGVVRILGVATWGKKKKRGKKGRNVREAPSVVCRSSLSTNFANNEKHELVQNTHWMNAIYSTS
jgi:hypothetical protein